MKIRFLILLFFCITVTGCMEIIRSVKRTSIPESLEVASNVILISTGAVNINVPLLVNHVDFFPSSFRIDAPGKIIYIDPVVIDDVSPADYIFITHAHGDHYSLEDIKKIINSESVILCPIEVYKNLSKKIKECTIKEVKPGQTLSFGNLQIETTAAYNMKSGLLIPHPKKSLNVGYVVDIDGIRIYHAGDTDYVPELNKLKDITVALVPIDGGELTMSTEKAAELINKILPKYAIPMHYSLGTEGLNKFKSIVKKEIEVIILDGQ